jgi:hypothetical protein
MAKLGTEVRAFIVRSVASFEEPSAVAAAVADEFGIAITRQAVEAYDPTKFAGRDLGDKWRDLFWATRTAFVDDLAQIGVSHRAVRLRALQRLASRAEIEGDLDMARKALDTAHREMSDVYAARRHANLKAPDQAAVDTRKAELLASLAATRGASTTWLEGMALLKLQSPAPARR